MHSKNTNPQGHLFCDYVYKNVIPEDHLLKRINAAISFSFVEEKTREFYAKTGRPATSPVMLFKMMIVGFLYNISDRRLEEEVRLNMAFKWFVGLDLDDNPPDHSTLTRFRERLGEEGFSTLFNRLVEMAREQGLVNDRLNIIDSTHVSANVDVARLKKHKIDDDDKTYVDRNSPDQDARFGRKSKKKVFYGYKDHVAMDADSSIVTGLKTTPGNIPDRDVFGEIITGNPETVAADKGYDSSPNWEYLSEHGIKPAIIPIRRSPGRPPKAEKQRPRVERIFAEAKLYHGKRSCRWLGIVKAKIQCLLTFTAINLKTIARLTLIPQE